MTESPSLGPGRPVAFDAYRLDIPRHRLWQGEREIPLRLGRLVTKDALHREVWPDTAASDNTLTQVIAELRQVGPAIAAAGHGREPVAQRSSLPAGRLCFPWARGRGGAAR
jgi:hypothetical protein